MAEEDKDKTEPATPFKLREAKKRGQVAKSLEFNSLFVIAGFLLVVYGWGDVIVYRELMVERAMFNAAADLNFQIPQLLTWFGDIVVAVLHAVSPLIITLVVIVILSNLIQTGPIFTFFPLKPDIKRINPVSGFKRVFSKKLLFEAFKNIIKLSLFGSILYVLVKALLPQLLGMMHTDPDAYPLQLLDHMTSLIFKLTLAIAIIAVLDFTYTRWDFATRMRMSRRELKEEVKRREGDPHVRAKIKELQREAAKRAKSLGRVPDADVLITNPTHLAVAILYRRGQDPAPQVIAKGAGELALHMKRIARHHRVPVIEDKPLAQGLYKTATMDAFVPEDFYGAVARVLARVYVARERDLQEGTAQ